MLIFPVFGSALAGMASYLRRDTPHAAPAASSARSGSRAQGAWGAESRSARAAQVEADNLVIAIVHQGEREEFDETARMSFAFALDQLRCHRRAAHGDSRADFGAAPKANGPRCRHDADRIPRSIEPAVVTWSADRNTPGGAPAPLTRGGTAIRTRAQVTPARSGTT